MDFEKITVLYFEKITAIVRNLTRHRWPISTAAQPDGLMRNLKQRVFRCLGKPFVSRLKLSNEYA